MTCHFSQFLFRVMATPNQNEWGMALDSLFVSEATCFRPGNTAPAWHAGWHRSECQRLSNFEWHLKHKRTVQQILAIRQAFLPLGQCDTLSPTVLEMSVIGKYTVGYICQAPVKKITTKSPGILEQNQPILSRYVFTFLKVALGMLLGFCRDVSLDDRPKTDHVYRTVSIIWLMSDPLLWSERLCLPRIHMSQS